MNPCLVQSSYLTMSWLPLQIVGTACSIHILHRNAMLKSYSLAHVDHCAFDIDSIFCECQSKEVGESNIWLTFASAKLECLNISNLGPGFIFIIFASAKLKCSKIGSLNPGIESHWLGDSHWWVWNFSLNVLNIYWLVLFC